MSIIRKEVIGGVRLESILTHQNIHSDSVGGSSDSHEN